MISLILRIVALILFLVGAFDQTLFNHTQLSLYGFALACWVLATIVGGWGPVVSFNRNPQ